MGLLYDHLMNHALEHTGDKYVTRALMSAPAYDVTNVLLLHDDWDKAMKQRELPRKAPHEHLWVEWTRNDCQGFEFQTGVVITAVQASIMSHLNAQLTEFVDNYDEVYAFQGFVKFNAGPPRHVLGRIMQAGMLIYLRMRDGKVQESMKVGAVECDSLWSLPKIPVVSDTGSSGAWEFTWPPLMAFALLHCRNVYTQEIKSEPNPPRLVKRGWPPLKKEHHVLRLELPNEMRPRSATDAERESERKMRFHLCRGHFKNLQHERYKTKGWHWWPAHWKGDAKIGRVDKSYELAASIPVAR